MTTLALLFLRTLAAIFYTFFVIILPTVGIYKIQEDFRHNLLEGMIMISIGGAFFFLSLRYVKRKMLSEKPYYKDFRRSAKRETYKEGIQKRAKYTQLN